MENGLNISNQESKCDQLREGHIVYISRLESEVCPVACLQKYLVFSKLEDELESYLICRLTKTKSGHKALRTHSICYSTVRDSFRKHLSDITNPSSYGLHSLRSGGATEAANNGVSDRLISKHGRWKSDLSRNRYIKENAKTRFDVTQKLGI